MRYKLAPGIEIRTENAAKPEIQASGFLKVLLSELPKVESTFDYGCGKLRYQSALLDTTDILAIVDSEIQLSRQQIIRGAETSIRESVARSNRVSVYNDVEFGKLRALFDRGFCINVLSVIPVLARRKEVLEAIRQRLRPRAECLFVVQYRNSDFTRMRAMPNAQPWRDGFLIDSARGYSFYGLIAPDKLKAILERAGFAVRDANLNEGSAYIWAARAR